ncbi:MAG: beta-ketoacyl synthase N-terminal-like domain-containing protein [Myxococcota bacterium]
MSELGDRPRTTGEVPIAVVGIGCRFPTAEGPAAYWRLLCEGRDAVAALPDRRRDARSFPEQHSPRVGGFLPEVDGFDWRTLRVSPREAIYMDPQHRLLLEVAWEAFEDAGLPLERVAGSDTGVFVGITWSDYYLLQAQAPELLDAYTGPGNVFAFAANRISYQFDLRGPSFSVDMACASSLGAIHQACHSLWRGESTLALVGGVSLIISPVNHVVMTKLGVLSRHDRCLTLDERADGFVRGEGVGLVVLKRLPDVEPGDRVYALIRGTALGHNGRNEWMVAPDAEAQERVIRSAYRMAGIDPQSVDYVELHGAASAKGDVVETAALAAVVGGSQRARPCAIGTVKTNIGYLDAAGGIAGLIKTALSLYHRSLVPMINLQTVNPALRLHELGLTPQQTRSEWPADDGHRPTAGVTSVSMSGCNVHVALQADVHEDRDTDRADDGTDAVRLVPLSARGPEALRGRVQRLHAWLSDRTPGDPPPESLRDIAYTTGRRRSHHEFRTAFVARSVQELVERLGAHDQAPTPSKRAPRIAWDLGSLRTGWLPMARASRAGTPDFGPSTPGPAFDQTLHACIARLEALTGTPWPVLRETMGSGRPEDHQGAIHLALALAMVEQWRAWGVEPVIVTATGPMVLVLQSMAGAQSRDDILRTMTEGRAQGPMEEGRMLVWRPDAPEPPRALPTEEVAAQVLDEHVDVLMSTAGQAAGQAAGQSPGQAPGLVTSSLLDVLRPKDWEGKALPWAPLEREPRPEAYAILGTLYSAGVDIHWPALCPEGRCVSLPNYPWKHRPLWIRQPEPTAGADHQASSASEPPRAADAPPSIVARWRAAGPDGDGPDGQDALLEEYLQERVSAVLRCEPEVLGAQRSLLELGLDSIMALEIINRLGEETETRPSTERFLATPTIAGLHGLLTTELRAQGQSEERRLQLRPGLARQWPSDTPLPLSFSQQALWTIDPVAMDRPRWNLFYAFYLTGPLHVAALEASLREIVGRHANLRVCFPTIDGRIVQRVVPPEQFELTLDRYSLSDLEEDELEDEVIVLATAESRRTYDLERGPLLRFTLIHCRDPDGARGEGEHVLFLAFHHAIFDLWSFRLFLEELGQLYRAFAEDRPSPLVPLEVGYEDFIAWQQASRQQTAQRVSRDYFARRLAGCPAQIDLPSSPPPGPQDRSGADRRADSYKFFVIASEKTRLAVELSRREGVTLYTVMLAVFKAVMFAHSKQQSLPVLSFNAQRNHRSIQAMIGMFSNAVVIRTERSGDPSFRQWLGYVRDMSLGAFEHQQLPLDEQIAAVEPTIGPHPPLLTQVFFIFQPFDWPQLSLDGIRAQVLEITHMDNGDACADLEWTMWHHAEGMRSFVGYRASVYSEAFVARLIRDFQTVLARATEQPGAPISTLLAGIG